MRPHGGTAPASLQAKASHDNQYGHDAVSAAAGNLSKTLPVRIGARVMLTENLWTKIGLVNGATGIVEDISWNSDTVDPRVSAPAIIMVRFDRYTGLTYFDEPGKATVVGNNLCRRRQFPLPIAYSITL
ncbi:hypothetical protein S40288_06004 [Stachybotrys chartarum IBT 40288]|nr:hypothetical protein S40288_06004 [Stachybotrys chartarum IBT 40288]